MLNGVQAFAVASHHQDVVRCDRQVLIHGLRSSGQDMSSAYPAPGPPSLGGGRGEVSLTGLSETLLFCGSVGADAGAGRDCDVLGGSTVRRVGRIYSTPLRGRCEGRDPLLPPLPSFLLPHYLPLPPLYFYIHPSRLTPFILSWPPPPRSASLLPASRRQCVLGARCCLR